jgi:hypothetical protein
MPETHGVVSFQTTDLPITGNLHETPLELEPESHDLQTAKDLAMNDID